MKKTAPTSLRKDYYELSDALQGFRSSCRTDPVIKDCIEDMRRILDKLHMYLNANYDWD